MANLHDVRTKATSIVLSDGKTRTIRFDLNAMAEIEERYGNIQTAFSKLEEGGSMKAVRFILWAGLVHEDEALTERQIGGLIDIKELKDIMEKLGEALQADMPAVSAEEAAAAKAKLVAQGVPLSAGMEAAIKASVGDDPNK
jgi:hypothetical protein